MSLVTPFLVMNNAGVLGVVSAVSLAVTIVRHPPANSPHKNTRIKSDYNFEV